MKVKKINEKGAISLISANDNRKLSRSAAALIAELPRNIQEKINYDNKGNVTAAAKKGKAISDERQYKHKESHQSAKTIKHKVPNIISIESAVSTATALVKQHPDYAKALLKSLEEQLNS